MAGLQAVHGGGPCGGSVGGCACVGGYGGAADTTTSSTSDQHAWLSISCLAIYKDLAMIWLATVHVD